MKIRRRLGLMLIWGTMLWIIFTPFRVYGYPVPPLPEDNLLLNPWFRSVSDPRIPGLDGWTNVLQNGIGWGTSQKVDNPSPEIIVSGKCGFKEVYCGTGARWANETAEKEVSSYPGVDVYLFQVVKTDPTHRKLKFFMHWVNHKIEIFETKIYGAETADGPWQEVWAPFSLTQDFNPPPGETPGHDGLPWPTTGMLEAVFEKGYPYFKLELHARYPEPDRDHGDVGVKVTGVYFGTELTDALADKIPTALVINGTQPAPSQNSTPLGDQATTPVKPQRTRPPQATPPAVTPAPTRFRPTPTLTETPLPSPTPTGEVATVVSPPPSLAPIPLASLTAGLLVLVVVLVAVFVRRRSN